MAESPSKRIASGLRRIGIAVLITGIILSSAVIGARIYLSDARLKSMVETQASQALGSQLNIGTFQFSVLDGLRLESIQLGNKDDDPFAMETQSLHIGWNWTNQSWTRVEISDFVIQGLAVYKNGQPQAVEEAAKETETGTETSLKLVLPKIPTQHWPLVVAINNIQVELKQLRAHDPEYKANLEGLMLEGSLALGDGLAQTRIQLKTISEYTKIGIAASSKLTLEGAPHIQIQLDTTQSDTIEFTSELSLPMANDSISVQSELGLDLAQGKLKVTTLELGLGEQTHLKTQLQAKQLYTQPTLSTGDLDLQLDFDSLQPFLDIFEVPLTASGKTILRVKPTTLPSLKPEAISDLILEAELETKDVSVRSGLNTLQSLNGNLSVRYEADKIHASSDNMVISVKAPQASMQSARLGFEATTNLSDWTTPVPNGETQIEVQALIPAVYASQASVAQIQAEFKLDGPSAILGGLSAKTPLTYSLNLKTGKIQQGDIHLANLMAHAQGTLDDIEAKNLTHKLDLTAQTITLPAPEKSIAIEKALAQLSFRKRGQALMFEESTANVDDLIDLRVNGNINQLSPRAASFSGFHLTTEVHDLQKLLYWAGPNPNYPSQLDAEGQFIMDLNGPIAFEKLKQEAVMPPLPILEDVDQWETEAQPLVDYVGRWMQTLSGELGFTANLKINIQAPKVVHNAAAFKDLDLKFKTSTNDKATLTRLDWAASELGAGIAMSKASGILSFDILNQTIEMRHHLSANHFEHNSLNRPLKELKIHQEATYRFGKDLNVERSLVQSNDQDILIKLKGLVHHPIRTLASGALLREKLPGVKAQLQGRVKVKSEKPWQIIRDAPTLDGKLDLNGTIQIQDGAIAIRGDMECDALSIKNPDFVLQGLMGKIPMNVLFESYNHPSNMSIAHGIAVGGGTLYLHTEAASAKQETSRKVYYEDLRPYRQEAGLEIGYLKFGDYELSNILLDAKIRNGTLSANHFSTELLGGDVLGNLTLKLNAKREFSGLLVLQASNIDASNFAKLDLEPGTDSELSADMRLSLFAAPTQRDINLDVNVTKIGKKTLDRFLQLLDPESKDSQIQRTRNNLQLINIHEVTAWIRHENLNMDLDYTTRLSIPGTNIGFRPIDRELLRRYAITEKVIDPYFQSYVDRYLAKSLGWNHEAP